MDISIDERFPPLVESLIKSARYASADEIVRQSMLLLEAGGENIIEDVDRALAELDEELKREGN